MKNLFKRFVQRKPKLNFFSQYQQDKWLYENFFAIRGGTFIEIGADDGIDKSNSYFFETQLDWNGLCIEPSPSRFKSLRKNRSCHCEEIAISNNSGKVEFMDISGWGKGLSGIVENYDSKHLERIQRELKHPENLGKETVTVNTLPLRKLLSKYNISHVDFCTIDTEGSEAEVIESIDFSKCTIDLFLIENNYEDLQVKTLLENKGYDLVDRVGIDDVFLRRESALKLNVKSHLATPSTEKRTLYLDLDKYRFNHKWFLNSEIRRELLSFISTDQVNNILEIGSFEGLSGTAFSDNLLDMKGSSLDCVDPFILSETGLTPSKNVVVSVEENCRYNINNSRNSNKCKIHKMKGDEYFLNNKKTFNLIYIDGSHEVEDIKKDMLNAFRCLRQGGIMWMDDYLGGDVPGKIKGAIDEVIFSLKGNCKIIHSGYQIAILKQ